MALTIVMQELVTVQVDQSSPARSVTQPEDDWIDLGPYQDLILYTYIVAQGIQGMGSTAAGTLYFETSPVKEDAVFQAFPIASVAANTTASNWSNPSSTNLHLSSGSNGFARWLRWRIVGGTANGTTNWVFRAILSVNPAQFLRAAPSR